MTPRALGAASLSLGILGWTIAASAQLPPEVDGAIRLTRAQIQADRQALVAANLELTAEERAAFWPLYLDYRAALERLGDRRVVLLLQFAESYETLTDSRASELLAESLELETERAKLRSRWMKRFQKILPGTKAVRFYQVENKLDLMIESEIASQVPLAR